MVRTRRAGVVTNGSMARAFASSQNGHADHDRQRARTRDELLQHVDVALDERRLGDDAHRVPVLGAHLEASARQPVARLERLVAVGHAAEDDELALPLRRVERLAQELGRALLDDDLAVEVRPGAEAQVLVRSAARSSRRRRGSTRGRGSRSSRSPRPGCRCARGCRGSGPRRPRARPEALRRRGTRRRSSPRGWAGWRGDEGGSARASA